jgi:4-oxalmesaconate hydratase
MKRPPLEELLLHNVYFDTCVYHQAGIDLLLKLIPADNILFGSEMVGAVRGIDPMTGASYETPNACLMRRLCRRRLAAKFSS